jgi:tetratricopeptide (TPR) repeat protein
MMMNEAAMFIKDKQYAKACEVLLEAVKYRDQIGNPEAIHWILQSLGSTWLFREQFSEQVAFFSKYLDRHPGDSAAYHERAVALWYVGSLHESVADFSRALDLIPTDLLSLSGRGQVLAELGESEKAMADLDAATRVLETYPRDPNWKRFYEDIQAFVRRGRGVAFASLGENQRAMAEFEASIELCPGNAWVYFSRAQIYDRAGERDKAVADYRTSLTKDGPSLNPIQRQAARERIDQQ